MSRRSDVKPSGALAKLAIAAGLASAAALASWIVAQRRNRATTSAEPAVPTTEQAPLQAAAEPPPVDSTDLIDPADVTETAERQRLAPDWRKDRTPLPDVGEPLEADAFIELLGGATEQAPATTATPETTKALETPATPAATETIEPKSGIFYGWFIVAAVFCILTVTSGVGFYNASVILAAATKELDASVGAVSGATGIFFAISGLSGFVFAGRLEKTDIRWFFVAGGVIGAFALLSLRWVTSVVELYAFFALFGIAFGTAGLVPATTLVTRWFERRRSVALSVASTGLSLGGIVLTPVSAWLIDQRTMSGAAPYLALIWIVGIIPIAVLALRSYPAEKGLRPDGRPPQPAVPPNGSGTVENREPDLSPQGEQLAGLDFATARHTRFFIALCVAYSFIYLGQVGAIAQLFNLVLERTDNATATTTLSVLAFSSVAARLAGGALAARVPARGLAAVLAVVQGVALGLLAIANSPLALILSAALFGSSVGNLLMLQPLLLAEAFGVANYPRIYSLNQLLGTVGLAGGPFLLGVVRDISDYEAAMLIAGGASLIGFVCIVLAGNTSNVQSLWTASDTAYEPQRR